MKFLTRILKQVFVVGSLASSMFAARAALAQPPNNIVPAQSSNAPDQLEGYLKIHPKYLYRYYIDGFASGQQCGLSDSEKLKGIKPGSRVHVKGKLKTAFSPGGSGKKPSPFGRTHYIMMDVESVQVLQEPTWKVDQYGAAILEQAPANLPGVVTTPSHPRTAERVQAEKNERVVKKVYEDLKPLFQKYYPKVASHAVNNEMHFEHDTRIFLVHEPLKTGEWQEAFKERGPNRGGILCEIELRSGTYGGAASVPQLFDQRYFTDYLLAPYSTKLNSHLYVHLYYPNNVDNKFLGEFAKLVNDFENFSE